jgi:hypothetical protein
MLKSCGHHFFDVKIILIKKKNSLKQIKYKNQLIFQALIFFLRHRGELESQLVNSLQNCQIAWCEF